MGYEMKTFVSVTVKLCPTLCDPMDCSLPGFSVHGTFQTRILEWVAISFSRGSSQPRDQTRVSRIVGSCFTVASINSAFNLLIIFLALPSVLEKEMATHSSILAWKIPGGLQSMGLQSQTRLSD